MRAIKSVGPIIFSHRRDAEKLGRLSKVRRLLRARLREIDVTGPATPGVEFTEIRWTAKL
jgi:hypothetical protein